MKNWKLALPFLLLLLPVLLQPGASPAFPATSAHAQSCATVIEAPRLTPDPPVCGQPTQVTVRVIDACGVLSAYLGFQGPMDGYFSWAPMTRSAGTRYDGHWTQTMWAFRGGGPLVYSIRVRRGDGSDFVSNDYLSHVAACNPISKVEVTPGLVTLDPGATQQFTARALDASGYEMPGATFTWRVVQSGGTITPGGLFTAGAALNTFTQTVKAETTTKNWFFDGKDWSYRDIVVAGFATVTVVRTLKRVEVYPANPSVPAGWSQRFSARAFDSGNQEVLGLAFSWSVVNGGGSIGIDGLFTAGDKQGSFPGTVRAETTRDGITVAGVTSVTVVAPCSSAVPQPATYSGTVMSGFRRAPDGATLVAKMDDYTSGAVSISGGRFKDLTISPPCGSFIGKTVTFDLNGIQANEAILFQAGDSRSLDLTAGAGSSIPLAKGWNLVSVPTPQEPNSISSMFSSVPEATKVFSLDGDRWLYATRSGGVWTGPLTDIGDGRAYWVFTEAAASLRLRPAALAPSLPTPSYLLTPGWNLVGYTSLAGILKLNVADYFKGLSWQTAYRYGPSVGYEQASPDGKGFAEVEAGRGYYVLVQRSVSPYDDEFNSLTLNTRWSWINGDPTHRSLAAAPGYLRIVTQGGNIPPVTGGLPRNLLLESPPTADFEMTTRLTFSPRNDFHQAGLLVYQSGDAFVKLVRLYAGGKQLVNFGAATNGWGDFSESSSPFAGTVSYLKIEKVGTVFKGLFSSDGVSWTQVAARDMSGLKDYKVGVAAFNALSSAGEINADFDYFRVLDRSLTWVVR